MLKKDQNGSLDENLPEGDSITHVYAEGHAEEVIPEHAVTYELV